ncbi:MAG: hypothetical protein J6B68_01075 [Lachnospiraceae bacterium]|nr:hypothetical protein [Lachnospiraceae bacterium]
MKERYKRGFDFWGLVVFFIIMIPNFIWGAVPVPNDILRAESVTGAIDTVASVCQVLMVMCLCIFVNNKQEKFRVSPLIIAAGISCILYFTGWIFYYTGVTNAAVILALCIMPCLTFLFFAIDRKNMIAIVPLSIFAICHLIYGIVNFIL